VISTPPPPQALPPPPNPPMFAQQAKGQGSKAGSQIMSGGFESTILGQSNPSNTGQKTLLGQ
jgi:hypothetical protein